MSLGMMMKCPGAMLNHGLDGEGAVGEGEEGVGEGAGGGAGEEGGGRLKRVEKTEHSPRGEEEKNNEYTDFKYYTIFCLKTRLSVGKYLI